LLAESQRDQALRDLASMNELYNKKMAEVEAHRQKTKDVIEKLEKGSRYISENVTPEMERIRRMAAETSSNGFGFEKAAAEKEKTKKTGMIFVVL
jgi:ferritin-like metal-binding protein YciE